MRNLWHSIVGDVDDRVVASTVQTLNIPLEGGQVGKITLFITPTPSRSFPRI